MLMANVLLLIFTDQCITSILISLFEVQAKSFLVVPEIVKLGPILVLQVRVQVLRKCQVLI